MLLDKIKKTKNRFRAYTTHQAVQTSGSTAIDRIYKQLGVKSCLMICS
jgi:hypothetical protein